MKASAAGADVRHAAKQRPSVGMVAVLLPVTGILPLRISPGYKLNRVFIQLFFIMMLSMIFAACSAASQQASSPSKMLVHAITLTGSREPV